MSQPLHSGEAPPARDDLEALLRRQNEVAIRCMAMENVVRALGGWLAAALPAPADARFLESLAVLPEMTFDPAMPEAHADTLKVMVARAQGHIVDLIRQQNRIRAPQRRDPRPRTEA